MNHEQFNEFILKIGHDLAGQRRCFDLVRTLLHENDPNLDDAKKLLCETILQLDLTQKKILNMTNECNQNKLENKIS